MLTTKTVQSVYGLCHHVSIIKKVRKHIWIISFGAQTKKTVFRGADPAETGQAGLTNFVKCKNGLHHCVPLVAFIEKHIWFASFGVRKNKLQFLEDFLHRTRTRTGQRSGRFAWPCGCPAIMNLSYSKAIVF